MATVLPLPKIDQSAVEKLPKLDLNERVEEPSRDVSPKKASRPNVQANGKQDGKLKQLQQLCAQLTMLNKDLQFRVQELEEELDDKNSSQVCFSEELSEMQIDFNEIQRLIEDYRKELGTYQEKINSDLQCKSHVIKQLTVEREELSTECEQLQRRNGDLEEMVRQLEANNQELLSEIVDLQSERKTSFYGNNSVGYNTTELSDSDSARNYNKYSYKKSALRSSMQTYETDLDYRGSSFSQSVQVELQKLIEKLLSELQSERTLKKKLMQEMKRMQKDLLTSERELQAKNEKIYLLEMNSLKTQKLSKALSNKSFTELQKVNQFQLRNNESQVSLKAPSQSQDSARTRRAFTAMQLLQQSINMSARQKLMIGNKIIDLFLRKIACSDYKSVLLKDITISNYSENNPLLANVKIQSQNKQEQEECQNEECTEAKLIGNLGFILDNLLRHPCGDQEQQIGEFQQEAEILDCVNILLSQNSTLRAENVLQLRKKIEQAIKARIS